ncbi:MAG: hypothetical protein AB7D28_09165 [Candidatus Berkiella sp.]
MSTKFKSLANALFSKTRQRVLGLLYGQPNKDFYTNEIIRHTQMGSGAVQRELEQLSSVGLITLKVAGNQKRYKANQASPLFHELRNITLKTFGLADVLREAIEPFHDKVLVAFIYGSIAKQTDNVNSDIDIMLIGKDLTYSDFFSTISETELKLERKINPTFHTPHEWGQKINEKNSFITKILNQPKIFLIGTEDELKKLG